MNVVEKILANASGLDRLSPEDLVTVQVETSVIIDGLFARGAWREILQVRDPSKVVIVYDHLVPASTTASAEAQTRGREFAKKFGITKLHDVGFDQGISHVIAGDYGYALPGTVMVNGDSHTCGGGAYNCAARGVGFPDLYLAITKGEAWFKVESTIRYNLHGALPPNASAKDVFLYIAGHYGSHVNQNVEFGGPGMATLSLNARRTIAIMGAELSAQFVVFEPDDVLFKFLENLGVGPYTPCWPDPDAEYAEIRDLDLSKIEPLVALPDSVVQNSVSIGSLAGTRIDQAFIGSCANGTLDDLAIAAKIVDGKRVAPGVRFIVTPGSQEIYRAAMAAGYVQTLMNAGAVVTPATCGACIGGHMGVLGPNEICITASTRNFKGRMGDPSAQIYMASPATVAASALVGTIQDPSEYVGV